MSASLPVLFVRLLLLPLLALATLTVVTPSSVSAQPFATNLEFGQQPTNTQAGVAITPAVTVRAVVFGIRDLTYNGNITIALGTNPGGGALSGTTTVAAVAGIAVFEDLSIDRAGSNYTLVASASGLTGATSSPFSITPGPASGATSTITAAPTSIPADGASTSTITVELRDAQGNPLASGGDGVVLETTAGTLGPVSDQGNGTYTAVLTAPAAAATATVSGTVNGAPIADTAEVTFTPVASRLEFGQQPTSAQAGTAIAPVITVRAVDNGGTIATSFTGSVTIALGTNPAGGALSGTTTVAAVDGIAVFADLSIDRPGSGYTLVVSASGLTGATSNPFSITPGPASGATSTITAAPTSVPADGASTSTITVILRDAHGNPRTTGGDTVVLETTAGTLGPVSDQGNGTYTAVLTAPAAAATATVSGVVNGAPIADTAEVMFTALAATRLEFGQQPTSAQAGTAIAPPVTVRAVTSGGTTVTSFTGNVTIAIGTNPAGGTLSGTTTTAAVAGVATFGNLLINRSGAGYTLVASASGLTGATSSAFSITPGPASGATSTITVEPTSVPADGISTATITVELRDAQGNRRTSGGPIVELAATAGSLGPVTDHGDGTYAAILTAPTAVGTATVSGTVNGAAITDTASVTFTTPPSNTNRLEYVQQPTDTQAGAPFSPPITVRVVSPTGTTVTSFTGTVTVGIAVNPTGGSLVGTSTVVALAGVATFHGLSIDRAGTGYRLSAGASGFTGATSEAFTITAGAASGATTQITADPISIPADGVSTSTITVEVRDAQGNRRTVGGDPVSLTANAGTLGPVVDLGSGSYRATLASSTIPGTATISGTVAGAPITDTATVAFASAGTSPTRLVFAQQPTNAQPGAVISPPISVRAVDGGGVTVDSFTGAVTITLAANPAGGTLSGTTTVSAVAGVATFGNLSIDRSGSGYTLAASASGLTGATSTAFTIAAAPASADLAITASVDDATPMVGDTVVYTLQVTNVGPDRATGVEVSYGLGQRLVFVSSVASKGTYDPELELWTIGTLESGESQSLEITARVVR